MADALISVKDLVLEAQDGGGWRQIVHGVSFDLAAGEVLGLIGESGAGKSSIGIAAMGRTRPGVRIASGSVRLEGKELIGAPEEDLRQISGQTVAYVAQSAAAAFNPAHKIIDQFAETAVQEGRMSAQAARALGLEIFRKLDLPDPERIAQSYPHQVSGGQLQRCMVAMAMACNPRAIIFDEPTTALDVTTQIEVLVAIRNAIAEFGTAAIYITHDLAVVAQIADRIMVLRNGREVESGAIGQILDTPAHPYTRDLLAVRKTPYGGSGKTEGAALATICNVSAAYGKAAPTIKDISLSIPEGRTVALVGESGSGKSTLGRVLAGLLPPVSGQIKLDGKQLAPDAMRRDKDTLRRIQMVYQSPDTALNPRHRVRKIVGRPVRFYFGTTGSALGDRVAELLGEVGLDETYLDRRSAEMSGGEKQRLCLARALAANPDLIICDEVTSALDQLIARDIVDLLKRIQQKSGVSYLFITHDIDTVRSIADDIVVLKSGEIVEQGSRETILNPPYADYTKLLLSSVPEMRHGWLDQAIAERQVSASRAHAAHDVHRSSK
ncbi:MAG: ABC transporter ATP-binding protein [Pseudomonadota bacterium]